MCTFFPFYVWLKQFFFFFLRYFRIFFLKQNVWVKVVCEDAYVCGFGFFAKTLLFGGNTCLIRCFAGWGIREQINERRIHFSFGNWDIFLHFRFHILLFFFQNITKKKIFSFYNSDGNCFYIDFRDNFKIHTYTRAWISLDTQTRTNTNTDADISIEKYL